jgi:hypothetical protein
MDQEFASKISEKREFAERSEKEVIKELQTKSFAQEIENDKEKAAVFIGRVEQAIAAGADKKIIEQEKASAGVYKRALILVGSGNLKVSNGKETKDASDNNLPITSYLSHGSRVMIEIPPDSGDKLVNWLTSGEPGKNGMSLKQSQDEAIKEGKIVYNRSAATHDVGIKETSEGKYELSEKKGFSIGLRDFIGNKLLGKQTKHFGVDLAMDAEFGGKDATGKIVDKPDGDHGHLYIHYSPPENGKPGSMLIGLEGAAPSSSKHSKIGASSELSPVISSKFEDLDYKKQIAGEQEYQGTVVPKKHQGMTMKLDTKELDKIISIDDKVLGKELAYAKACRSPGEFKEKIQAKDYHKSPEFKASKAIDNELPPKPSFLKRALNMTAKLLTFGIVKPFDEEIKLYDKSKKISKKQQVVINKDESRCSRSDYSKYTESTLSTERDSIDRNIKLDKIRDVLSTQSSQNLRNGSITPISRKESQQSQGRY